MRAAVKLVGNPVKLVRTGFEWRGAHVALETRAVEDVVAGREALHQVHALAALFALLLTHRSSLGVRSGLILAGGRRELCVCVCV